MTPDGKKGNTIQNHATTLWLASEFRSPKSNETLSPFGWTELGRLTPDMETQLRDMEKVFQEKRLRMMADEKKRSRRDSGKGKRKSGVD